MPGSSPDCSIDAFRLASSRLMPPARGGLENAYRRASRDLFSSLRRRAGLRNHVTQSVPPGMTRTVLRYLAWGLILGLFIVTDTTPAFRPHTLISANIDRFAALFIIGAVFSFAYPKHVLPILPVLLAVVVGFELIQRLLPGRHGYVKDMFVKGAGCCAGVIIAVALRRSFSAMSRRTHRDSPLI